MNLLELQTNFINAIYHKPNLDILLEIKEGKAPKEELLGIYKNNLLGNLGNSLKLTFENVLRFLKEERFMELAMEYIVLHPSQSNNLDNYGENFSEFLFKKEGRFISDIAKLDWLKLQSYLAKNTPDIDLKSLQKLKPEDLFNLKFILNDSLFLLESNYNLLSKRRQSKEASRKNYFLIYRHNSSGVFEVVVEKIPKTEFLFLTGVKNKLSLYEIYEKEQIEIHQPLQKYLSNKCLSNFIN